MASIPTWLRYIAQKTEYSFLVSLKKHEIGRLSDGQIGAAVWRNLFQGRLTSLIFSKGEEMAPTLSPEGETLLVRRFPHVDKRNVFVGDVVALKNPLSPENSIVRRLSAVEGEEMVSTDEKDEAFVLDKNECWVTADNEALSPKYNQDAADSRLFGPVPMTDILGRVLYAMRSAVDHGPVRNSDMAMQRDSAVLACELDVDDMAKNHKA